MKMLKKFTEYFQGLFEVIFSEQKEYQYSLKNVDLKIRDNKYDVLIKYILIGSRRIQRDNALDLLNRRAFSKFNEVDAEIIVTANTAITLLNCDSKEEMLKKFIEYIKIIQEKKNSSFNNRL